MIFLFATFREDEGKFPYHIHQAIKVMCDKGYKVFFSTSNENVNLKELDCYPIHFKQQVKNEACDFGQFRKLFEQVWKEGLSDEVIIMNDSCFMVPENLYRLDEIRQLNVDFWGVTYNAVHNGVAPHLQSYFLGFKQNVTDSKVFKDFWKSVDYKWTKADVIHNGECMLTKVLYNEAFRFAYFADFMLDQKIYAQASIMRSHPPVLKIQNNSGLYEAYKYRWLQNENA